MRLFVCIFQLSATAESFAVIDAVGDVYMCYINFEVQVCHWACDGDPFVKVAPGHGARPVTHFMFCLCSGLFSRIAC